MLWEGVWHRRSKVKTRIRVECNRRESTKVKTKYLRQSEGRKEKMELPSGNKYKKGGKKEKIILTDEVKENEKKVPSSKTFEKLNPSNISPGEFQRDDSLVLSHRQHRQRQERAQP